MNSILQRFILISIAFTIGILSIFAQKRKPKPTKSAHLDSVGLAKVSAEISSALNTYQFSEAEKLLTSVIKQMQAQKQPSVLFENQLAQARRGQTMLHSTSKITIIDSFVVERKQVLETIKLSQKHGEVLTLQQLKNKTNLNAITAFEGEATAYINEFKDRIIYPAFNSTTSALQLVQKEFIGGKWQQEQPLKGLPYEGYQQNFPFLMADGITIYYGAQGAESLGGYDIFVSRYNRENKQFLLPENIGMPFNSPANDYLYAIDEINNLGWFVSDRYQPLDKVCVYVFVPYTNREIVSDYISDTDSLRIYAGLQDISYTQGDKVAVEEGKKRLATLLGNNTALPSSAHSSQLTFMLNDSVTYTSLNAFRSPQAKQYVGQLQALTKQIATLKEELEHSYMLSTASREKILQSEKQLLQLTRQEEALCKKIRALEMAP